MCVENNKVFFNGKAIFTLNESYGGNFRNLDNNAHCIIHYNYEIIDFHKRCLDDHGNLDDLVDIAAGRTHFVVLTSEWLISYTNSYNTHVVHTHTNTQMRDC